MDNYFRLYPGGTRPEDVSNMIDAITAVMHEAKGGAASRAYGAARRSRQAVLVPTVPGDSFEDIRRDLHQRITGPLSPAVDVIMKTSGSTSGRGHLVGLSASALEASARATLAALGGPGRWILALPIHHIAGFQVLVRSVIADIPPVVIDTSNGFTPQALARAVKRAQKAEQRRGGETPSPLYISLVPTQLRAVLEDPEATQALAEVDRVLVGGAPSGDNLLETAQSKGITVVTTYGMTETCGGCVYDGVPLSGVDVATIDNLVWISGTTLMEGYVEDNAPGSIVMQGYKRWFKTSDAGHMEGPRLVVDGRIDDVINTGGVKIQASLVEEVLLDAQQVEQCCVVGVPDIRWGQLVTAVFVPSSNVDWKVVEPLAKLCGTEFSQANDEPEPVEQAVPAKPAEPIDYAALTPLEAAMAAMAAKIRGEDVDVVEAAKTGRLPNNIYEIGIHSTAGALREDGADGDDVVDGAGADGADGASREEAVFDEGDADAGQAEGEAVQDFGDEVDENTLAVLLRSLVTSQIDRAHAPRAIIVVDELPMLPSGKVDRQEVKRRAANAIYQQKAWLR